MNSTIELSQVNASESIIFNTKDLTTNLKLKLDGSTINKLTVNYLNGLELTYNKATINNLYVQNLDISDGVFDNITVNQNSNLNIVKANTVWAVEGDFDNII